MLVQETPLHLPQPPAGTDPPLRSWERPGMGEELQRRVEKVKGFSIASLGRCPRGSASLSR